MRSLRALSLAVSLMAVAGCSSVAVGETFDLVEFAVSGPDTLSTTTGSVSVTNSGMFGHTLVVTDSTGTVVTATPLIQPGESADLELGLEPGQYNFTCRIVAQTSEGRFVDHFEAGMYTTVTVDG